MRPRPEGRGELELFYAVKQHRGALQCGHDPKAVENIYLLLRVLPAVHASMRPRPEGRGERREWRRASSSRGRASMRPRPEGRGEPCSRQDRRARDGWRLQCGHDPKAVENLRQPRIAADRGASFNAATTRRPWRTLLLRLAMLLVADSFNAATTRRPWRTPDAPRRHVRAGFQLQCGHDPKAVENDGPPVYGGAVHAASMRPRPEGRGERRRARGRARRR